MFRLTVLYPKTDTTRFDFDYYENNHLALARRELEPYGVLALEWDHAVGGRGGSPAPFYLASHQIWNSRDDFQTAADDGIMSRIAEDVPNFYNDASVVFFSDVNRYWTRDRSN